MRAAVLVAGWARRFGSWPSAAASAGGDPPAVTFPQSSLVTRVWIALTPSPSLPWWQWGWVDITEWVRKDLGISVEEGRRNEAGRVNTTRGALKLGNPAGRFVRLNPLGPYYPHLTRNTPIWIELDAGAGFVDMVHAFVNELPTRWTDPSGNNSYVTVKFAGVMRRLAQGRALGDALDRTMLADSPVAYWRMNDPAGSNQFASSLPGLTGFPLQERVLAVNEGVEYGVLDAPPGGSGSVADFSAGGYVSSTRIGVGPGVGQPPPWTVTFAIRRPADESGDGIPVVLLYFDVGGTIESAAFGVNPDADVSPRDWYHFTVTGTQNGGDWEIHWWRNGISKGLAYSGAGTLGDFRDVVATVDILAGVSEISIAYIGVYAGTSIDAQKHSDSLQAYTGEQSHLRLARIAAEIGVPFYTDASWSAPCGPQPNDTALAILRDAEKTDQGVLYEHQFGLAYQALSERYNRAAGLNLDFAQRHVYGTPETIDDDQRLRNEWTIRNSNTGVSRTARNDDSITTEGLYDDADAANLADDDQIYPHASHRVWLGIQDELRWQIALNLGGTPDLITAWQAARLNDRVLVANPPPEMPPGDIDVILEGRSQRWDQRKWTAALNLAPARPYQVGQAGDTGSAGSWADTAGAVLAEDVDTTEAALDVTSDDDWTTSPGGELLVIGGEHVTLDAVSGSAPNWVFTVTRSANTVVKTHSAGAAVRLYRPAIAAH